MKIVKWRTEKNAKTGVKTTAIVSTSVNTLDIPNRLRERSLTIQLTGCGMQLYLALAIPILLATAWLYTAQVTRSSLPNLRGKRICLLIAHPDDEAMFFSPTVLGLTAPEATNHLKILCLSSGAFSRSTDHSAPLIHLLIELTCRKCRWTRRNS